MHCIDYVDSIKYIIYIKNLPELTLKNGITDLISQ